MTSQRPESQLKKVLIVSYYWPPSGGSGVQRWLKFVKYLPQFGWQPFVFTPENPSFEIRDDTLARDIPMEAEVIHFPIWEPYGIFRKISFMLGMGRVKQTDMVTIGKKTAFQKIAGWVRGNLFVPDARVFWVKPSVRFLADFLKSNEINTIITTGPPHSLHLIGEQLKKLDPSLRWFADMRDPWSEWDFLDTLSLSGWTRRRHQRMERKVLRDADRVITIAPYHVDRFEMLGGRKVDLITNGFDEDDFKNIRRVRTTQFTVRHIGMVDELRDPRPFMLAVKKSMEEKPEWKKQLRIEFIGSVNSSFRNFVSEDPLLSSITSFLDPLPHADLVQLYGSTDIQLLILAHTTLAPGNLPGKFFEYMASGNFIFGVGPEAGDAARILQETGAGQMIDRQNSGALQALFAQQMDLWRREVKPATRDVSRFNRRKITEKLSVILAGAN